MPLKHDITGMVDNLYGCDGQLSAIHMFLHYIIYLEVEFKFLAFAQMKIYLPKWV